MARKTRVLCRMETENWTSLFPSRVDTEERSKKFVFHLLGISVSSIMYLRSAFPDRAFADRNLDGLRLKLLDKGCEIAGVGKLCQKLKGAMDALKKRYLKTLTVGFYVDPTRPEDALETYAFNFDYNSDDGSVSMELNSSAPATQATRKSQFDRDRLYRETVRSLKDLLQLTQNLSPLPDQAYMTLQLLYYDERTPRDYEPPGFESSNLLFKLNEDEEQQQTTGQTPVVKTPWHTFSASIRSVEFLTSEVKLEVELEESDFDFEANPTQPPQDSQMSLNSPILGSERPLRGPVADDREEPSPDQDSVPETAPPPAKYGKSQNSQIPGSKRPLEDDGDEQPRPLNLEAGPPPAKKVSLNSSMIQLMDAAAESEESPK